MSDSRILGCQPGDSFVHVLNATAKIIFLILVSITCMVTYNTRLLIAICILPLILLKIAGIEWKQASFIVKFTIVFTITNTLAIFIFRPTHGESLHRSKTVLINVRYFTLTVQELFYLPNVGLRYICFIPLVLLFLLTASPSQFAASLNKTGVGYKVPYAISLVLHYIPNIQEGHWPISAAQQARGSKLPKKASLSK